MALDRANSKSRNTSTERFVVCLRSGEYAASLEPRKLYVALPDQDAERQGEIRIIDESGEDYLYPAELFAPISVREGLRRALLAAP
jgi:hypothetical protein